MMPENEQNAAAPAASAPVSARRPSRSGGPALAVALVALALAGWQWFDARQKLADVQQQVSRQLGDFETRHTEERGAQKQTREQFDTLQARLGALDGKLAEYQAQAVTVQSLVQDVARSREEVALLEIEQAITLAGQQLQLAGNVPVAVLALQTADARLARLDRPLYVPLRKALAKDLERLNALPFVDTPGVSVRLEQLVLGVDKLPLVSAGRPEKSAENQKAAEGQAWWRRVGSDVWQEVKGLVRIQRFDRDDAALLAPGQGYFLRENLKLRLLNARLALFSRDQWTFRNELKAAQEILGRHFEPNDKAVQAALATLKQMTATEINVELPTLADTQGALRAVRQGKEKR